jgi:hypothetical protein
LEWVGVTGHKELARLEVVVDRLHYLEQVFSILGIVQEVKGSNTIEGADFAQPRGVCDTVLDAQGLRVFLLLGKADHLRRNIDANYTGGTPLLE